MNKPSSSEEMSVLSILLKQFSNSFNYSTVPKSFSSSLVFPKKLYPSNTETQFKSEYNDIFDYHLNQFLSSSYDSLQMKDINYFQENLILSLKENNSQKMTETIDEYLFQFKSIGSSLPYDSALLFLPSLFYTLSDSHEDISKLTYEFYDRSVLFYPNQITDNYRKALVSIASSFISIATPIGNKKLSLTALQQDNHTLNFISMHVYQNIFNNVLPLQEITTRFNELNANILVKDNETKRNKI